MLRTEDWHFAIEDARTRHQALMNLILATDQQAMSLLALYVTLGSGAASAFVASIGQIALIPSVFTFPLLAATVMFAFGAFSCLKVVETKKFSLPGRDAEFWLWASRDDVEAPVAYREYLTSLQVMYIANVALNNIEAVKLNYARQCGIAAPIAGVALGIAIEGLKRL